MQGSISGNIFWENIRNFLILKQESSISWNIRTFFGVYFFCFLRGLGWEVYQVALIYTTPVLVFYCWLWTNRCRLGYPLIQIKKCLYRYFVIERILLLINKVWSLCAYAISRIVTLKHWTNTLKIVKNESVSEVLSIKSLILLNELEHPNSFFPRILL